jgi:hypothetical protein
MSVVQKLPYFVVSPTLQLFYVSRLSTKMHTCLIDRHENFHFEIFLHFLKLKRISHKTQLTTHFLLQKLTQTLPILTTHI